MQGIKLHVIATRQAAPHSAPFFRYFVVLAYYSFYVTMFFLHQIFILIFLFRFSGQPPLLADGWELLWPVCHHLQPGYPSGHRGVHSAGDKDCHWKRCELCCALCVCMRYVYVYVSVYVCIDTFICACIQSCVHVNFVLCLTHTIPPCLAFSAGRRPTCVGPLKAPTWPLCTSLELLSGEGLSLRESVDSSILEFSSLTSHRVKGVCHMT